MEKAAESFAKIQQKAEERFFQHEEEQWKKEVELQEKRQREAREHELRIMQILANTCRRNNYYDFDEDSQYDY